MPERLVRVAGRLYRVRDTVEGYALRLALEPENRRAYYWLRLSYANHARQLRRER